MRPRSQAFRKRARSRRGPPDVRTYLALHYARGQDWARAAPLLEQVVAEAPERVPALEALAVVRERQGRLADAVALRQQIYRLRTPSAGELVQLGQLAMSAQQTQPAIEAFETARAQAPEAFTHDLELGVLYLAAGADAGRRRRARPRPLVVTRVRRWRSSSARRSACCCASRIRRRASTRRADMRTRRRGR